MKKNKTLFYLLSFILIGFYIVFQVIVKPNKDFDIFIGAAKYIAEGKSCYGIWLHSGDSGLKYYYSPLFGLIMYPFSCLPQFLYNIVWLIINLFVLIRLFKLTRVFLIGNKNITINYSIFYFLLFLSMARIINDNFDLGQMTFILVWASLESLRLIYIKQLIAGTALLALIINIKILPITVLCYLIYKKELKATAYTILFFIAYLYLPVIFLGIDFNNLLLHDWLVTLTETNKNSIAEDIGRQSLSSLIPSLLMETNTEIKIKTNLLNLNETTITLILNLVRIIFLIVLIPFLGKAFQVIKNKKEIFFHISLIFIITPIFFPHQGKYSLLFLLPAYAYCLFSLIRLKSISSKKQSFIKPFKVGGIFVLISFALITLTTDGLIGRHFADIAEHLHLLVFGAIILLAGTMYLKPKRKYITL